jgi:hypothetical protein
VIHGVEQRSLHHMRNILNALPLIGSHRPNSHEENNATLRLPLAVVESGASYCNRLDQFGRPIVYLKLGKLGISSSSSGATDGEDWASYVYTRDDYIYSMLHTLER